MYGGLTRDMLGYPAYLFGQEERKERERFCRSALKDAQVKMTVLLECVYARSSCKQFIHAQIAMFNALLLAMHFTLSNAMSKH